MYGRLRQSAATMKTAYESPITSRTLELAVNLILGPFTGGCGLPKPPAFIGPIMAAVDHAKESLDRILHSDEYVCRPHVEIFTEHEIKSKAGAVVAKVTKDDLDATADTGNRKAETGDLTPFGPGHTYDDEFDDSGKLLRKFPEEDQPPIWGYFHRYSVERKGDKWSLFADQYVKKQIADRQGNVQDGIDYTASFPRRSPEYYPSDHWIDYVALLRRAPRLDMGLVAYAKSNPERAFYVNGTNAGVLGGNRRKPKLRYAFGGDEMDDDKTNNRDAPGGDAPAPGTFGQGDAPGGDDPSGDMPDPTQPPDDQAAAPPAAPEELPPEHKEAAEKYAQHLFGMHHTQARHLMHHMHHKYSGEAGLPMDKMMPHTGAAPIPGMPGPGMPGATNTFPPKEHQKMHATDADRQRQVQADIAKTRNMSDLEKERYARQKLETRLAVLETGERKARYERDLTGLLGQGYDFDLADEMKDCIGMDDETFKKHYQRIKKHYQRAPIGGDFVTTEMPDAAPGQQQGISRELHHKAVSLATREGISHGEALTRLNGKH